MGEEQEELKQDMIRIYVMPEINTNEFLEVNPEQLDDYLNECKDLRRTYSPKKNTHHHLAIIAKVDVTTTEVELDRLLRNDVRTLLIQTKCNKPQDIDMMFIKVNTAIDKFYMENSFRMPIGVAVEINGEQLTTGRMRNDIKPYVEVGHIMVFTTNEDYRYCCFKEIIYVSNLWKYLDVMKIGDTVRLDNGEVVAKVVKCGYLRPLTVEVTRAGYLSSYMNVGVPYYIETRDLNMRDLQEVESAVKYGAHFLVVSNTRSSVYLRALKDHIGDSIKLLASLNYDYIEKKFFDIAEYIVQLEAVWLDNMFLNSLQGLIDNAIAQCHSFEKATVGSVPLKTCSDFKKFENHDRIKQMDCLLIERSSLRKKFPLIAKKLLPVLSKRLHVPELENPSCAQGLVNFVLRTISSIPCQGIVVSTKCPKAAIAFAIPQVYCPVICVVKDDTTGRSFNLRRNLVSVIDKNSKSPIEFGIDFARQQGIFKTGDFVISISDALDESSQVCINLRAYYLPPLPITITTKAEQP